MRYIIPERARIGIIGSEQIVEGHDEEEAGSGIARHAVRRRDSGYSGDPVGAAGVRFGVAVGQRAAVRSAA
jgi:hypothetical protein